MKFVVIGAHLLRDDVEPHAEAIPVGDLFLSALSVPDDQPLGDRELLVHVARIRARLLEAATFVAIRYGFSTTSVDDAMSKCSAHLARWKRLLIEHREHVELTLKTAAVAPQRRPDRHGFTSGAEYLRALHAATQSAHADASLRDAANELLVPLAKLHRWLHRDEKSIELALLVDRGRLGDVRSGGESLRERCPNVPFLLSGPWPLEVFADADHE
ncbi:MAG TPA: GvpL/GvpF family gas vesicle protein [Thermoanaerobaculia bacterium]|nr:GvpL/GvpF family gas vesicle protein [Thermoanaerobaculia bacterium]